MATSQKKLNEELRNSYLEVIKKLLANNGEEVLVTGSNEIAIPCVDSEQNDKFVQIIVKVPTGSRDGDLYDGYSMAEDYEIHLKEKKEKAEKAKELKAKKIERDKKMREQQKKLKEEKAKRVE